MAALPKNVTLKVSGMDALVIQSATRDLRRIVLAHRNGDEQALRQAILTANASTYSELDRIANYVETVINAEKN